MMKALKSKAIALAVKPRIGKKGPSKADLNRNYLHLILLFKVLSLATPSIKSLISALSSMSEIIGPYSKIFRKLHLLTSKWGVKVVKAISYTADSLKFKPIKTFLYRLSYSISIGIQVDNFANLEYQKFLLDEERDTSRRVDRLRVYCEAYSALLNANVLIAVISIMVGITFGSGNPLSILATVTLVILAVILLVLLIFRVTVPQRGRILDSYDSLPKHIRNAVVISKPALLVASVICVGYSVFSLYLISGLPDTEAQLKFFVFQVLPVTFGASGAMLLLIGRYGNKKVADVAKLDELFLIFVRSLGNSISISNSIKEAIETIRHNDYKDLNSYIERLYRRIKVGAAVEVCWKSFLRETGSLAIRSYGMMFLASIRFGSNPIDASNIIADAINREIVLRSRRSDVANYLKGMVIPLQAILVAIFTLIASLLTVFYKLSKLISFKMPITIMNVPNPIVIVTFLFVISIVLTLGNSIALYVLKGDSIFTLLYYLGILLLVTSVTYVCLSYGLDWIFGLFAGFEREVSSSAQIY